MTNWFVALVVRAMGSRPALVVVGLLAAFGAVATSLLATIDVAVGGRTATGVEA